MRNPVSRREFLQVSSASAIAGGVAFSSKPAAAPAARGPFRGTLCLFSKPVPQLHWRELAASVKSAGFGGIDLTVRPGGHVLPERAAEDLPRAVEAIRAEGLEVPMITTELVTVDDPTAIPIIRTASRLSIPLLKPGYYHYRFINVLRELKQAGDKFRALVGLAQHYGIQVGFHNHSGYVGAPVWDIMRVMDTLDPKWAGYYFDLLHATAEGGVAGWKIDANLVMPRMKIMSAKDFYWKKTGEHTWRLESCPLGEGMCHWTAFLKTVAQANYHGPITLHMEYSIPGVSGNQGIALSRAKVPQVMAAAKRDLDLLKSLLREAYEGAS